MTKQKKTDIHTIATLPDAIYETVHHNNVPLRRIADAMGIEPSTLTRYALDGESGAPMPAYRIEALVLASKSFLVLDFIEKSLGRIAFQLPPTGSRQTKDIAILTIQALKEFGEFLQEIEKALNNDGKICAEEYKKIQWESYHAIQKILELIGACEVHQ